MQHNQGCFIIMRLVVFCILFMLIGFSAAFAQQDSVPANQGTNYRPMHIPVVDSARADSAIKANREQFLADSIAMVTLMPDSARENQFNTGIFKDNFSHLRSYPSTGPKTALKSGVPRNGREQWLIVAIIGLVIYTALLNLFLGSDIKSVIQSFYIKNAFSANDKEGGVINAWAFIGLFILFSLTLGIVLYQYTIYKNVYYNITGVQLFISLSIAGGLLLALKFLVLKFIGFVFDINNLVSQYISILNLTYFNIAFVLLAVSVSFSLLDSRFVPLLLALTLALIVIIFAWQYIRNSINIISNFRFHKFYLFIYLCALEICPVLILIKALNI